MAETLEMFPFPPLTWTGSCWFAQTTLPGFSPDNPVDLQVGVPWTPDLPQKDAQSAPPPTTSQAAAFAYLLDQGSEVCKAVLAAVQKYDTDDEVFEPDGTPRDLEFVRASISPTAWDGTAYMGYEFGSLDTWLSEHGLGVIAHRDRVVFVGMMEQASDESLIARDIRRLKRERDRKTT